MNLDNFNSLALDRPVSESKAMENLGVPLPNILKIEEPLQEGPLSFFHAFICLKTTQNFGMNLGKNWPHAPIEMLSSSGIRLSNASVSMGTVQSGSLGFLQRQQEISDVEKYAFELSEKIKKLELELDNLKKEYESLKEEQESSEEESRKLEFSLLSSNKELEHHQLEERRMQQSVSQLSQDSESILEEINSSKVKESTAVERISSLENERSELEIKTEIYRKGFRDCKLS